MTVLIKKKKKILTNGFMNGVCAFPSKKTLCSFFCIHTMLGAKSLAFSKECTR